MCLLSLVCTAVSAQSERPKNEAIRVFVDCDRCDSRYLRTEIRFINHVRDRLDSQVHVLVTRERSGGGGRVWTLDFFGREEFEGMDEQLVFYTTSDDTDDIERSVLVQTLRLGLVRYVARTPLGRQVQVSVLPNDSLSGSTVAVNGQAQDDPWNYWVFRTRFSMYSAAEEREQISVYRGSISAYRTTEIWKVRVSVYGDYREETFKLNDSTFTNIQQNSAIDTRVIKSLGDHMGVGLGGSLISSTYRNQDLTYRVAPAIEYNFFPYAESTRRQFTVSYSAGYNSFGYESITIFDKLNENRGNHAVQTSFDIKEPWGESDISVEFSQFLDKPEQKRFVLHGELEVRLFRGLSLNLHGASSLIHDQIYLPRVYPTDQQILVRQRQLPTDYEWQISVGLVYSFGSIYNNVVNSRFAGSAGGFTRAF